MILIITNQPIVNLTEIMNQFTYIEMLLLSHLVAKVREVEEGHVQKIMDVDIPSSNNLLCFLISVTQTLVFHFIIVVSEIHEILVGNSKSLNHFLFQVNDFIFGYCAFSFQKSINRICHCQVVAIDLRGHGEEEIWKFYFIKYSRKREINLSNSCCAASRCKMQQFHMTYLSVPSILNSHIS